MINFPTQMNFMTSVVVLLRGVSGPLDEVVTPHGAGPRDENGPCPCGQEFALTTCRKVLLEYGADSILTAQQSQCGEKL